MVNKILIIKWAIAALQVALIVLLITTGLHFKDIKQVKDLLDLAKNIPDFQITEEANKVYTRYGLLLAIIILSTLKVPVISAGLFLNNIFILCGSFLMDVIINSLYIFNLKFDMDVNLNTETGSFTIPHLSDVIGSLMGFVCSTACGFTTIFLIVTFRKLPRV